MVVNLTANVALIMPATVIRLAALVLGPRLASTQTPNHRSVSRRRDRTLLPPVFPCFRKGRTWQIPEAHEPGRFHPRLRPPLWAAQLSRSRPRAFARQRVSH